MNKTSKDSVLVFTKLYDNKNLPETILLEIFDLIYQVISNISK